MSCIFVINKNIIDKSNFYYLMIAYTKVLIFNTLVEYYYYYNIIIIIVCFISLMQTFCVCVCVCVCVCGCVCVCVCVCVS